MRALGKTYRRSVDVEAEARRLNLDTSHFAPKRRNFVPVPGRELPFANPSKPGSQSGLTIAARWFLDRGYIVSVPLEPAPYDLVTESDEGLKRVQVKTTRQIRAGERYTVDVGRLVYDPTRPYSANGPASGCLTRPVAWTIFSSRLPNSCI
jgi:PD-(D/E)XK endonuclease